MELAKITMAPVYRSLRSTICMSKRLYWLQTRSPIRSLPRQSYRHTCTPTLLPTRLSRSPHRGRFRRNTGYTPPQQAEIHERVNSFDLKICLRVAPSLHGFSIRLKLLFVER